MHKSPFLTLLFLVFVFGRSLAQKSIPAIDTQRFGNLELLWDLKKLSAAPAFTWLDSTSAIRSLTYESVPNAGKPARVFAYYSNPDLLMGQKTERTFPGIVLVHGGGGEAFKEWVEKWAAEGYAALAMDLGGKGADGKQVSNAGPDQTSEFKFTITEQGDLGKVWSYHAVANVILAHSLLLNLPEADPDKTALTGISWGGYLTCIVAGLDNRFKAAVPVYGCGYYDESDVFGKEIAELSPTAQKQWMKYFDPSVYLPYARSSLLFVNGNKDRFYNLVPFKKTYDLPQEAEKNICLKPDMKHSHAHGWAPIEIRYFVESVLNQGVPLPKLEAIQKAGLSVGTTYDAAVGLRSARFYYSSDTTSLNENRIWSDVEAKIDFRKNALSAEVPNPGFDYGFFYVIDNRGVSVSSPIWVKKE